MELDARVEEVTAARPETDAMCDRLAEVIAEVWNPLRKIIDEDQAGFAIGGFGDVTPLAIATGDYSRAFYQTAGEDGFQTLDITLLLDCSGSMTDGVVYDDPVMGRVGMSRWMLACLTAAAMDRAIGLLGRRGEIRLNVVSWLSEYHGNVMPEYLGRAAYTAAPTKNPDGVWFSDKVAGHTISVNYGGGAMSLFGTDPARVEQVVPQDRQSRRRGAVSDWFQVANPEGRDARALAVLHDRHPQMLLTAFREEAPGKSGWESGCPRWGYRLRSNGYPPTGGTPAVAALQHQIATATANPSDTDRNMMILFTDGGFGDQYGKGGQWVNSGSRTVKGDAGAMVRFAESRNIDIGIYDMMGEVNQEHHGFSPGYVATGASISDSLASLILNLA